MPARRALVVANDAYEDAALARLRSAAADAEALQEVLGAPQIGGFGVELSTNQASHEVQARIEDFFAEAKPDDLLLLYFSGHGLKAETGELFLAATNTRPSRLASSAVPADFVHRCMRTTRSRCVVLFLDCCYGGAFPQGAVVRAGGPVDVLSSFPEQSRGSGRGQAVITASTSMEYSFEGAALSEGHSEPSVFTAAFVEGLRSGDADRDCDGLISLDELYDYLYDRVRLANPAQTPSRKFDLQGELHIAASNRRREPAAALPGDLQAAITDPNMFTRIGAVSELRRRLASPDLPTAAAALTVLRRLVVQDIEPVAAVAQAAIDDARLSVEPAVLVLPAQPAGARTVHELRLTGVPLALQAPARAESGALTVSRSGDVLQVAVQWPASASGLVLEGPAETVRVPIRVEAGPDPLPVARAEEIREPTPAPARPPAVAAPFGYGLFAALWALGALQLLFSGPALILAALVVVAAAVIDLGRGRSRVWPALLLANAVLVLPVMLTGLVRPWLIAASVIAVALNLGTAVRLGLGARGGTRAVAQGWPLLGFAALAALKGLIDAVLGVLSLDGPLRAVYWLPDGLVSLVIAGCCVVAGVGAVRAAGPAVAPGAGRTPRAPAVSPAGALLRHGLLSPAALIVFGGLAVRNQLGGASIYATHIMFGLAGVIAAALAVLELLTRRGVLLPLVILVLGLLGLPIVAVPAFDGEQFVTVSAVWAVAMLGLSVPAWRAGRPLLGAFCTVSASSFLVELAIGVSGRATGSWPATGTGLWVLDGLLNIAATLVMITLWGLQLRAAARRRDG